VLTAPSGADVLTAIELAEKFQIRLVVAHTADVHRVAESAAGKLAGFIVGPLDLSSGPRTARAAGLLEARKIPVAIAGGLPQTSADSLRVGAALAARAGLSPAAARRAITSAAAELLGVSDRLGAVAVGQRADLVVFSGDPLDLRTRVLAVYVGGLRVHLASPAEAEGEAP
jgi:imidazolonepropionase-like amidohydrolase